MADMNANPNTATRRDARADFDYVVTDRIQTLRKRASVTQKSIATAIGITESSMSDKLSSGPWLAWEIATIAPLLNTTVNVLCGVDPVPEPTRPARVTKLDPSKNAKRVVGPTGIEPMTSTVIYGRFGRNTEAELNIA